VYHRSMRQRQLAVPSFEELLGKVRDLPEGVRGEILDSTIVISDAPSGARAHTIGEISAMVMAGSPLGDPVPESWSFLASVEVSAGNEGLLTCDVAGWHLTRQGLAATCSPIRSAPAWVCEVLGGRARRFSLSAKRRAFAEMGVEHLWLADPEARVLDVFRNDRSRWLLVASLTEEQNIAAPPFETLRFDVADLWTPVDAKPPPSSRRRPA
jgi:hypothetical protein